MRTVRLSQSRVRKVPSYAEELEMLAVAAQIFLEKVENMTTEEFSRGDEKAEREFLRRKLNDCRAAKEREA